MKTPLNEHGGVRHAVISGYEKRLAHGVREHLPKEDRVELETGIQRPGWITCTIEDPLALEQALGQYHDAHKALSERFWGIGAVLPSTIRAWRVSRAASFMQRQLNPKGHPYMPEPLFLDRRQ